MQNSPYVHFGFAKGYYESIKIISEHGDTGNDGYSAAFRVGFLVFVIRFRKGLHTWRGGRWFLVRR